DEDPRVVAARGARRCDPVREEMERLRVEQEILALDDLEERSLAPADLPARRLHPGGGPRFVEVDRLTGGGRPGKEHAGLLEGLPDGGDPEPDAAGMQPELRARGRVVPSVAAGEQLGRPIAGVDGAARE